MRGPLTRSVTVFPNRGLPRLVRHIPAVHARPIVAAVRVHTSRWSAGAMAPRSFVRLREVVYTLSPFEQDVMGGLFKDIPYKMTKYWNLWGKDAVVFGVVPYFATVWTAQYIVAEEEKSHRY